MKCKICEAEAIYFSTSKVLNKYDVNYFQCKNCGFVQTEEPYWLEEAYSSPIANSDTGLVMRNIVFSKLVSKVIFSIFRRDAKFLDYGCGYGLFVRIMRSIGLNFYGYDRFCENIFAKEFEVNEEVGNYELITAFEVFEHFIEPCSDIKNILKFSRNVLFSTELLPKNNPKPREWYYYAPHEGQHISIYTTKALSLIAEKLNLNYYTNGASIHLFTEKNLHPKLSSTLDFNRYEPVHMVQEMRKTLLPSNIVFERNSIYNYDERGKIPAQNKTLKILVDSVFFQLYSTGIARVWRSLLEQWTNTEFASHIIVLDRANTSPKIPGIRYRQIPAYSYNNTDADKQMLQQVCDEEGADLFISTYYTTPISTPSVFMAYDMIPETLGANFNEPMWREKHHAISHASSYISISESTARDLVKFFPDIKPDEVTVAHCGVASTFTPATTTEITAFKDKYGISKPYFLLVGAGGNYKNAILFFRAFAKLHSKQGFEIVCTGSGVTLANEYREYAAGTVVHSLILSDEELKIAYSGAVALVYPSLYEGFGMPVAEALACGCPVITCANASIPEVAGEAAIYVDANDVDSLTDALCEVQKPKVRNSLIAAGLAQVKKFSWDKMANIMSAALMKGTLQRLNLREINLIIFPDWSQPEETVGLELQEVIKILVTHLDRGKMTLLIDNSNISVEEADLILSSVAMNLLMEEELEVDEGPEIVLVGELSQIQWSALMPQLQGRIKLDNENKEAIAQAKAEKIVFN